MEPSQPVVLIGLDGATFDVLDPYVEQGVMPFLGELMARGVRAPLRTVMPPLTPPAWTSLVTGKRPGQHGVFDFFQKEARGSIYFSYASSQDIRSATIWTLASDHGRRVTALNFPLMFPPPPVNGAVVPGGMMPWRQLRLGCHPPGLFGRLQSLPGFNPREMLDMEMEVKAIDGCPEDEYAEWVDLHIRREQRWAEVLAYLMAEEPADLTAILFDGVDKLQHLCWRFIDPSCRPEHPTDWERSMIGRCESYFRSLDGLIAQITEAAGPAATLVFASDHGFGPTQDVFHVNSWLEQRGYLRWSDAAGAELRRPTDVGFAEMTRHVHAVDWTQTIAYAATPSSQSINIVERVPGSDRPLPEDVRAQVSMELAAALLEEPHPETGERLVEEVWTREQAFVGPYEQLAPDLSMVLANGGTMSILPSESIVARRPQVRGHHRWEGMFVAAGPGIRAGARVGELSILDVAPLILHRLGLPIPDDVAGRVPGEVLEPGELLRNPPKTIPAAAAPPPPADLDPGLELDAEEQANLMERLRALGYVE
ncbi:MAG: alkaline phosphatase family protein [Solirubrobacteraceae bacterium]